MSKSTGTVKWFDTAKGYGFILNDAGEDVMVHYSAILAEGFRNLLEGQIVTYTAVQGDKGWQATEVEVADSDEPAA